MAKLGKQSTFKSNPVKRKRAKVGPASAPSFGDELGIPIPETLSCFEGESRSHYVCCKLSLADQRALKRGALRDRLHRGVRVDEEGALSTPTLNSLYTEWVSDSVQNIKAHLRDVVRIDVAIENREESLGRMLEAAKQAEEAAKDADADAGAATAAYEHAAKADEYLARREKSKAAAKARSEASKAAAAREALEAAEDELTALKEVRNGMDALLDRRLAEVGSEYLAKCAYYTSRIWLPRNFGAAWQIKQPDMRDVYHLLELAPDAESRINAVALNESAA